MGRARVAIVSSYSFEDTNAAKARVASFLTALEPHYDVHVICRGSDSTAADERIIGVDFPMRAPRNFFLRGLAELLFSIRLARKLRRLSPALAIVTVPSMFLLIMAKIQRFPVIFDVRDLVWEYLPEQTFLQKTAKRLLTAWCQAMLVRVKAITVTNRSEKDYLCSVLKNAAPIEIVANGLSRDRFDHLAGRAQSREEGRDPRKQVLYIGNVGLAQDLSTLVNAAARSPNMRVTIVGTGNDLPRIRSLIVELALTNVTLVGGTSWTNLLKYYDEADALYAQIGSQYHTAVPSKLAEYMVAGRPVIFGGVGASAAWLQDFSGVAVIRPFDVDELASALDTIDELQQGLNSAANRQRVLENYIRDDQATVMVRLVRDKLKAPV